MRSFRLACLPLMGQAAGLVAFGSAMVAYYVALELAGIPQSPRRDTIILPLAFCACMLGAPFVGERLIARASARPAALVSLASGGCAVAGFWAGTEFGLRVTDALANHGRFGLILATGVVPGAAFATGSIIGGLAGRRLARTFAGTTG